jgi:photosystem II stability/assembly factor-like uncharacterized protein
VSRARRAALPFALLLAVLACGCSRRASGRWQAVELPTNAVFNGIWFTDSLNGWISGDVRGEHGGLLGRTRDGGRTWTFRSHVAPGPGESSYWGEIQFRDTLHGCVVGDGGAMLTADGGLTFRRARPSRPSLTRLQLAGADGWALGSAALIGTSDSGETWHELVDHQDPNQYLAGRAAAFTDASHGWLLSFREPLMRSDDGGHEWTPVPLPLARDSVGALNDITFVDASHGWLVGEFGTICRTRDGGVTWERQVNGVPVERVLANGEQPRPRGGEAGDPRLMLLAVRFADLERGFAAGFYGDGGGSVILGTRDGGASWVTEATAPGQILQRLFVLDRRHAWAVGADAGPQPTLLYRYTADD